MVSKLLLPAHMIMPNFKKVSQNSLFWCYLTSSSAYQRPSVPLRFCPVANCRLISDMFLSNACKAPFIATQLNSTQLNCQLSIRRRRVVGSERRDPVEVVCGLCMMQNSHEIREFV